MIPTSTRVPVGPYLRTFTNKNHTVEQNATAGSKVPELCAGGERSGVTRIGSLGEPPSAASTFLLGVFAWPSIRSCPAAVAWQPAQAADPRIHPSADRAGAGRAPTEACTYSTRRAGTARGLWRRPVARLLRLERWRKGGRRREERWEWRRKRWTHGRAVWPRRRTQVM